jgi:hypothetical protein
MMSDVCSCQGFIICKLEVLKLAGLNKYGILTANNGPILSGIHKTCEARISGSSWKHGKVVTVIFHVPL